MTAVELTEHGPPLSVPLDDTAGRALAHSGAVEAAPDPNAPGQWRLRAKNLVGAVAVPSGSGRTVTVRILPKISIARLLFLLGYSQGRWRTEHVPADAEQDLLPAFAHLFALQAERSLAQGLLQGYREAEETALVMRGRVRHSEQVRRHYGRLVPLEITHDEYTTDIAENRLLRTACETLLRLPGGVFGTVPADVRGRLLRLRARLGEITPVPRGHPLPTWRPSRLNARYDALRLAELVLRGASVEHRSGDITVHGFLFDLARVFEDFVTAALRDALAGQRGHRGHCVRQDPHPLDGRGRIRMMPDLVAYDADGSPVAVVDVKYKAERPAGYPYADLYQMLAYCTALNLPEGHLVYGKGEAPHGAHRVRNAGITIHQHALDLDQPPDALLDQVRMLAWRLAGTGSELPTWNDAQAPQERGPRRS